LNDINLAKKSIADTNLLVVLEGVLLFSCLGRKCISNTPSDTSQKYWQYSWLYRKRIADIGDTKLVL